MLYVNYDGENDVLDIVNYRRPYVVSLSPVKSTKCVGSVEIDCDKNECVIGVRLHLFIQDAEEWGAYIQGVDLSEEFLDEVRRAERGWRYLYGKTKEQLWDLESRLRSLEIDHERDPDD